MDGIGDDAMRKGDDRMVDPGHVRIVKPSRGLQVFFGVGNRALQFDKYRVCFEVGIFFDDNVDA